MGFIRLERRDEGHVWRERCEMQGWTLYSRLGKGNTGTEEWEIVHIKSFLLELYMHKYIGCDMSCTTVVGGDAKSITLICMYS